jgi:hypothetical protein
MRRSLLILLLSTACFSAHAQDTDDFSRYSWGTPLTTMQAQFDLKPVKRQDSTACYSSNVSSLGGAELDDCQFEFINGKFSGVAATTPGKAESDKLLRWLKSRLGPGESREPLGWQWFKEGTHVWFDMSKSGGEGWLYWYSLGYQTMR